MFDIIGKRRWFFLLSGLVTIPGLIFILLTPLTSGQLGLKFSIDYTGGTIWEIHFENGTPNTNDVRSLLAAQGFGDSTVVTTSGGYIQIRTRQLALEAPAPTPTPAVTRSPSSSARASASASASASATTTASTSASPSAAPTPSPTPTASPTPSPTPSPSPSASPSPSPTPATAYTRPTGKLGQLADALVARFGPIDGQRQLSSVGPIVSSDLINQAFLLILMGSIGILAWITVRFHDMRMGATALVALLHDVIVVVGTFAVLGTLLDVQVDSLFVTAMLTVIGFSVHDTIVVYDRIRENRSRHAGEPFAAIVNHSVLQTFGRSINTSLTVIVTLLALLLFGGSAIRVFVLALLLGITSGTYSSIFNASPLLVVWHEWDERRRLATSPSRSPR